VRLFFALWPPLATAQALAAWAREVSATSGGRVTATENIHLTLAFLGDVDPDMAISAARQVNAVCHSLPIDSAKYVRRNEMVWVGPAKTPPALEDLVAQLHGAKTPPALEDLVAQLHAALRAKSFRLEDRPFATHVTLVRKARQPTSIPPLPKVDWPAGEFILVRSRTSSKGSTYEPVERFPLDAVPE
jgi:RNA 2',3'-cyclic 3'-phosphodiesterase